MTKSNYDSIPVDEMYLSLRTLNILLRDKKYLTFGSLRLATDKELLSIRGIGKVALDDIREGIRLPFGPERFGPARYAR